MIGPSTVKAGRYRLGEKCISRKKILFSACSTVVSLIVIKHDKREC